MIRPPYALPFDVVRRFDPTQTHQDLERSSFLNDRDRDRIRSRIQGVEDDFESRTDTAFRLTRKGSVGAPGTYEYHSNKYWNRGSAKVYLDRRNIVPFDPSKGDRLELRTGIDRWRDITHQEGTRWTADYSMGKLQIFARTRNIRLSQIRRLNDNRFVRVCYRYGTLGGDQRSGGQTALSGSLAALDQDGEVPVSETVDVENAARLPSMGSTVLITGEKQDDAEYVDLASVDAMNDTVTLRTRGVRGTIPTAHESGATVHYCPMNVREAIAGKAAEQLVLFDDWADRVTDEAQQGPSETSKLSSWSEEFENAVARYAEGGYA